MIVDRIHKYLDQDTDKEINEEWFDNCLNNIKAALISQLFSKREDKPGLRLSGIGKCLRAQAYGLQGLPKKPIGHRQKLTFLMGDIIEELVVLLAKHAGVGLTDEQKEVMFHGVKGHIDGIVTDEKDNKYVFECKSMSSYSYDSFKRNGMDNTWGYVSQLNSYASALDTDMVWVGWNKNTGHLHEEVRKVDPQLVKYTELDIDELNEVGCSPQELGRIDAEEETWYKKPTGNLILGPVCSYCDYNEPCWGGKITKYLRGGKIKHYVGEIKHGKWTYGGEVIND